MCESCCFVFKLTFDVLKFEVFNVHRGGKKRKRKKVRIPPVTAIAPERRRGNHRSNCQVGPQTRERETTWFSDARVCVCVCVCVGGVVVGGGVCCYYETAGLGVRPMQWQTLLNGHIEEADGYFWV